MITKVVSRLSPKRMSILRMCPGEFDGDKVAWLVDFFEQTLEARAKQRDKATKEAARPRLMLAASEAMDETAKLAEREPLAAGGRIVLP